MKRSGKAQKKLSKQKVYEVQEEVLSFDKPKRKKRIDDKPTTLPSSASD